MSIADPVMMPSLITLLAICTIWCGLPAANGQIQKDFKYLATRPAEGSEFFRISAETEPQCVNVCVQNEDCHALMYLNAECVGYRDGETDGEDLAGAVAMEVIGGNVKNDKQDGECYDIKIQYVMRGISIPFNLALW